MEHTLIVEGRSSVNQYRVVLTIDSLGMHMAYRMNSKGWCAPAEADSVKSVDWLDPLCHTQEHTCKESE